MKIDMRSKPRWYSALLAGLILLLATSAVACGKPAPTPTTWPRSPESAILGKWRHGLPEKCPPSMDTRLYEELEKLPENETYYLEFFKDGQVLCRWIANGETYIVDGTYTFIGDDYVKIAWSTWVGALAFKHWGGHGVYKVEISGDKMTLEGELETMIFRRVP